MGIGFKLHHFAKPRSPTANFEITIPSRLSSGGGSFKIIFYVPPSYVDNDNTRFPVVVNFHGGGFTLGTETDDARWAAAVVQQTESVVVSVAYRLAPEYAFSVGVEDCADAIIYLAAHAEELSLDPHRIAISGFSAGANFALTVPLMLHELKTNCGKRILRDERETRSGPSISQFPKSTSRLVQSSSSIALAQSHHSTTSFTPPRYHSPQLHTPDSPLIKLTTLEPTTLERCQKLPDFTIVCIIAFYPPVDFRQSRQDKRLTNPQPKKNLPYILTNLFDQSYIVQSGCDLADPYLSPAAACDEILRDAYPQDIVLYTCEYDMLNTEGVAFGQRLRSEGIGKTVHGGLIKGVVHAFDKKPNPISFPKEAELSYTEACTEIKRVFKGTDLSVEEELVPDAAFTVLRFENSDLERYTDIEGTVVRIDDQGDENGMREPPMNNDLGGKTNFKDGNIVVTEGNKQQSSGNDPFDT